MPRVKTFGERIADALVEDGLLTVKQVEELLEQQKKEGTRLLKLILEKAYVSDQDMAVSMGRVLNTAPINLARISIPLEVADLVPRELAHNYKVVPVSRLENRLFLAMADPLNVLAIDDVRRITKLEVAPLIASEKAITDKLNHIDSSKSGSMEDIIQDAQKKADDDADADSVEVSREPVEEVNLDQLAASSEEAPVVKLANLILVQAVKDRASDIHIEPFEKTLRLRYRIDGVLMEATPPPKQMQLALVSRFKVMSSLDISERRLPQDGRMRVRVGGRDIDLRVSFLPGKDGPVQMIRNEGITNFRFLELSPEECRPEAVEEIAHKNSLEPFDLLQGPLYRVDLLRRSADDHVLVFTIHHAIADGWTLGVFVQELIVAYFQRLRGIREPLPPAT